MTRFHPILPAVLPSDTSMPSNGRSAIAGNSTVSAAPFAPGVASDAVADTAKLVALATVSSAMIAASRSPLEIPLMPVIPTAIRAGGSLFVLIIAHLQFEQRFHLYKIPRSCFTEDDGELFGRWTGPQCLPMLHAVFALLQQWAQRGYLTSVSNTWMGGMSLLASNEYAERVYLLHFP